MTNSNLREIGRHLSRRKGKRELGRDKQEGERIWRRVVARQEENKGSLVNFEREGRVRVMYVAVIQNVNQDCGI